jgi:hypothetical protein
VSCQNADQVHILAFATVMLNSDLHHAGIRPTQRMTLNQFVGIVSETIPGAFKNSELADIYHRIKSDPLTLNLDGLNECLALTAPKIKGSLMKRGQGIFGRWREHFFVLTHGFLYYFERSRAASDNPLGVIEIRSVDVRPLDEDLIVLAARRAEIPYVKFVRRRPTPVHGVREIVLRAAAMQNRDKWVYRLRTSGVVGAPAVPALGHAEDDAPVLRSLSHEDFQAEEEEADASRAVFVRRCSTMTRRPSCDEYSWRGAADRES